MNSDRSISRRAALRRLGLGLASAYVAPAVTGLSMAYASSGGSDASDASAASGPSPASKPSPASAPSPASPPSPASAPSSASPASRPSPVSLASRASPASAPSAPSGPGRPRASTSGGNAGSGTCRQSATSGNGQITRTEYERAQQAIARGEARPLQEVLQRVNARYPGRALRIGFSQTARGPEFRVLIVNQSGAVVSVTVDAGSGTIKTVQNC